MDIGAAIFFTEYSISPAELASAILPVLDRWAELIGRLGG
jgi:hypothetical protein